MILASSHHHPCIVEKRIVLVALEPRTIFWVVAFAAFSLGAFLDGVKLYCLLGFLNGASEIARRLSGFGVGFGFGGVHEDERRAIVVFISSLHLFEGLFIVLIAIEVDVVARGKCLIKSRCGCVLFGGTSGGDCDYQCDCDYVGEFLQCGVGI